MMGTSQRGRAKRRVLAVLAVLVVTVVLLFGGGAAGYAWWQVQGNATINISTAKLDPPELVCEAIVDLNDVERNPNFRWVYKCYIWPKNSEVTEYVVRDSLNNETKILRKGGMETYRDTALVFHGPLGTRKPGPNDAVSVSVVAKYRNCYSAWVTADPLEVPKN